MRRLKKVFLVLAAMLLFPVAAGLGVAAVAYSMGTIVVEVDDGHSRFTVPVPAGLVTTAARFLPEEVCRDLAEVEREIGASPWSLMRTVSDDLEAIEDGVLVEVDSHGEQVRVTVDRGDIVVQVESGSDRIHVSAPLRTFSSVARSVEATCS